MRSFIVFLTIALVSVVAVDEQSILRDIPIELSRCIEKTGISQEQLLKLHRGGYSDEKEVHDTVLCFLKRSDFFTEENGFNVEQMVARYKSSHVDDAKTREIITKCVDRNEQGSTPAAWGFRVMQCLSNSKIAEILSDARGKVAENNN